MFDTMFIVRIEDGVGCEISKFHGFLNNQAFIGLNAGYMVQETERELAQYE